MNELKPVASRMKRLDETIFIDNEQDAILFAEQGWVAESVYIIPDTHRVVSVKLLKRMLPGGGVWNLSELQAIIDKEQS